jgi:V8-like Glu-specific endopeptidase
MASISVSAVALFGAAAPLARAAPAKLTPQSAAGALWTPLAFNYHSCSGVVVHSTRRDLVATAAHCMVGTGSGYTFAPGFTNGASPYGRWTARAVWADSHWKRHDSARYDLALLAMKPQHRGGKLVQLEDVVPGARLASAAPAAGTAIEALGYGAGVRGSAVDCRTTTTLTGVSPTFACPGFVSGTSGGPWFADAATASPVIVGLTGGLHQGGCVDDVSYATPLGAWSDALLARAEHRTRGDALGFPPGDGC